MKYNTNEEIVERLKEELGVEGFYNFQLGMSVIDILELAGWDVR